VLDDGTDPLNADDDGEIVRGGTYKGGGGVGCATTEAPKAAGGLLMGLLAMFGLSRRRR
jgi:MYXO-CTERM domain-containing protein